MKRFWRRGRVRCADFSIGFIDFYGFPPHVTYSRIPGPVDDISRIVRVALCCYKEVNRIEFKA